MPGTGAAISSFLAYNEAKRTSKHPEEYGHGSEEAVVASESANNAVTGATLIPLLTLGIPGDTNTAVLLGALTMQGIAAGPQLFTQHGEWVYTIMLGLIAVNIFMYLQGRVFIRGFVNITRVPTSTLVHGDVQRGFILEFEEKPNFAVADVERLAKEQIAAGLDVCYLDEDHIRIGNDRIHCTGPRIHVANTADIPFFAMAPDFVYNPINDTWLVVGVVDGPERLADLSGINKF